MTRFITGIVVVALIQIAFGIYLSTERLEQSMRNASAELGPVFDRTIDLTVATIADNDLLTTSDGVNQLLHASVIRRKDASEADRHRLKNYRKSSEVTERNYRFENASVRKSMKVVVSDPYSAKPSAERRHEATEILKVSPKSEGRSFIAKVVPIIKKPYDWLKAVGSKLGK